MSWPPPPRPRVGSIWRADGSGHQRGRVQPLPACCAVPELTRSPDIQLNKRLSLRRLPEMLPQPKLLAGQAHRESSKLMDSVQHCRDQATECVRLMKSAPTKDQARLLENISISWARLTGQIDRHDALVREQGRGPAAA
jgi:hypothetical protein